MPRIQPAGTAEEGAAAQPGKQRRRLRSSTIVLGGMGALAAVLSACSSEPDKRCVDRNSYDVVKGYKVVSSHKCGSSTGGGAAGAGSKKRGRSGGSNPEWYYGSEVDGRRADYGTFSKSAAVDRGGFGCSGSRSSGG